MKKKLLLINPWIVDFAAFDLWSRPVGFLYIASLLEKAGFNIQYIDCLDRFHLAVSDLKVKRGNLKYSTGCYYAEEIKKPKPIAWVKRKYKRYGIPIDRFIALLKNIAEPDAILVTSRMSHWYIAVQEVIQIVRRQFKNVPVILGGTYTTLYEEHSRKVCNPDYLVIGESEVKIFDILSDIFKETYSIDVDISNLDSLPFPAYYLMNNQAGVSILTSRSCPMNCNYCASKKLFPTFRQRSVENIVREIEYYVNHFHTTDIGFIDDALLVNRKTHIEAVIDILLEKGIKVNFHAPNGIHSSMMGEEFARKMRMVGFKTVRLSLESANPERIKSLNRTSSNQDFMMAGRYLKSAGFSAEDIGVYVMIALPGQTEEEVKESIDFVIDCGVTPKLTEYSPIPHTALWERAIQNAVMDIADEPLLCNNTVYHQISKTFSPDAYLRLKNYIRDRIQKK